MFDLKSGKATCADESDNTKDIKLVSVGDDGLAYGWADGESDEDPVTPVAVTMQGSKPLPVGTRIPDAVVDGVGVFALDSSHDTARLVVLIQKGRAAEHLGLDVVAGWCLPNRTTRLMAPPRAGRGATRRGRAVWHFRLREVRRSFSRTTGLGDLANVAPVVAPDEIVAVPADRLARRVARRQQVSQHS